VYKDLPVVSGRDFVMMVTKKKDLEDGKKIITAFSIDKEGDDYP